MADTGVQSVIRKGDEMEISPSNGRASISHYYCVHRGAVLVELAPRLALTAVILHRQEARA